MTVQAVDTDGWVSVSEMARLEGVSTQMIYIRIRDGVYDVQAFTRGSMNGYLVRKKKEQ